MRRARCSGGASLNRSQNHGPGSRIFYRQILEHLVIVCRCHPNARVGWIQGPGGVVEIDRRACARIECTAQLAHHLAGYGQAKCCGDIGHQHPCRGWHRKHCAHAGHTRLATHPTCRRPSPSGSLGPRHPACSVDPISPVTCNAPNIFGACVRDLCGVNPLHDRKLTDKADSRARLEKRHGFPTQP